VPVSRSGWALGALLLASGAHAQAPARVEIEHQAVVERVAEQGILTPVPIRLRLPPGASAERVLVHFKAFGSREWATLELERAPSGWEGAIPCLEISTITGVLRYYIRAYDEDGRVIATSGSRETPYTVVIKSTSDAPRGLGGAAVPRKCPDPTDCPRGLPGCGSEPVERVPCHEDSDCEGGLSCGFDGFCEKAQRERNWIGVSASQDFAFLPTRDACSPAGQTSEGFTCFRRSDGAQYNGAPLPDQNRPIRAGLGPSRVNVSFDRLVLENVMLGIRVGWAFYGERTAGKGMPGFVPFGVEARLGYLLGDDLLARAGFRPFALVLAGAAQFDTRVPVKVTEDLQQRPAQRGNDIEQTLDANKRAGDFYVGLGAGALIGGSRSSGWIFSLRVLEVFPFGATIVTPELGYAFGF
jgi:hypothetical protein